jgi:hypothetical protein
MLGMNEVRLNDLVFCVRAYVADETNDSLRTNTIYKVIAFSDYSSNIIIDNSLSSALNRNRFINLRILLTPAKYKKLEENYGRI